MVGFSIRFLSVLSEWAIYVCFYGEKDTKDQKRKQPSDQLNAEDWKWNRYLQAVHPIRCFQNLILEKYRHLTPKLQSLIIYVVRHFPFFH